MQAIINETPVAYLCIVVFFILMIVLALFHFGYKEPKRKREENKPIIDTNKGWWSRAKDENFNGN